MEYTANSDKITRDYFDSLLLDTRFTLLKTNCRRHGTMSVRT